MAQYRARTPHIRLKSLNIENMDMDQNRKQYLIQDLAIIVPTKDRPQKIRTLLESIERQNVSCGRIIIIDSGL